MNPVKKYEGLPGFDIDPVTGKYYPVAVDIKAVFGSGSRRSTSNAYYLSRTKRSKLGCGSSKKAIDAPPVQADKCRKVENGVRKELFKVPTENWQKWTEYAKNSKLQTSSGVCKSLGKLLPSKSNADEFTKKLSERKKSIPSNGKFEQSEGNRSKPHEVGYCFKPPVTPQLRFNVKEDDATSVKTPDSQESNIDEFLKLEHLCKTPKATIESPSPISSVCNLFKNKMILKREKETEHIIDTSMTKKEIIAEIRRINKSYQELHEDTSSKIQEVLSQQTRLEQKHNAIMALVDKLDEKYEASEEKENCSRRRSLRLRNKSSENQSSQITRSPVILKSGDLRKSALTKSLVNKCQQYQIGSPRTRALDMYNSTRNKCSALLTPKFSRSHLVESSASFSLRNNLSLKVQKQCLMLQDAPQESPAPK